MRLFLIPISTRHTLIYTQRLNKVTQSTPSIADKASARAAQLWLKWESGDKGWQRRITEYGNKLFNRIPFEEWGLKSIPPLSARRQQQDIEDKKIDVIYPPSIIDGKEVSSILRRLATERNALHRKRMIWSIAGMPIMAPVGLIPLVPNIPFIYLAYRAFSHWKALSGANHLKYLVERDLFRLAKSNELDAVYSQKGTTAVIGSEVLTKETKVAWEETNNSAEKEQGDDILLIGVQDASDIAKIVNFPALAVECERACRQVADRMQIHAEEDTQKLRVEKITEGDKM